MGQDSIICSFFARRAKKATAKGQSPPQELEVGSRSGPYLLVATTVLYWFMNKQIIDAHATDKAFNCKPKATTLIWLTKHDKKEQVLPSYKRYKLSYNREFSVYLLPVAIFPPALISSPAIWHHTMAVFLQQHHHQPATLHQGTSRPRGQILQRLSTLSNRRKYFPREFYWLPSVLPANVTYLTTPSLLRLTEEVLPCRFWGI